MAACGPAGLPGEVVPLPAGEQVRSDLRWSTSTDCSRFLVHACICHVKGHPIAYTSQLALMTRCIGSQVRHRACKHPSWLAWQRERPDHMLLAWRLLHVWGDPAGKVFKQNCAQARGLRGTL